MSNDTIVQFVCFVTNLDAAEFIPKWKYFAQKLVVEQFRPALQEKMAKTITRFRYISQHECDEDNFYFSFMKGRTSEFFPEHAVRVINAGGYLPLELKKGHKQTKEEVRLIACINIYDTGLDHYRRLPLYLHLNIYKAYYESCLYSHIMEFIVPAIHAEELEQMLKHLPDTETGIYRACVVA
ncbi:hypothetical protein [Terrimonas pollutisoli]|uniref:hypothetical protein n=1 Tax=Terrimonas pollutisoli TaxID=3034147 RepID=UPI0023ECDD85|nr:hypothetical protein [Terrimonas sp. H1YJ31]